jgi:LysM repeat protein
MKVGILKVAYIFSIVLCISVSSIAQPAKVERMTPEEYILSFKEAALRDMARTGVPASITIAQGIYESDCGNSPLAREAKNHFGIKCHKEWNGPTYHQDDDEADECFRTYTEVLESYDDHSDFLRSRERYKTLFDLKITDYQGWAHGLKKAGYATNPQYAHKIIGIIERYDLARLDRNEEWKPTTPAETLAVCKKIDESAHSDVKTKKYDVPQKTAVSNHAVVGGKINNLPVVKVCKGDTWIKLSRENNLELNDLLAYNDADKSTIIKEGEYVFIKPKKNKASEEYHIVQKNETLRFIAQIHGVKLEKVLKMNQMTVDMQPKVDQKIYLKKPMLFGLVL